MAVTHTCETLPADPKAAIRRIKQDLRAQIGDVQAVFDRLTARIAARLEEIDALKASGQDVWPTILFADIARGQVTEAQRELIKRRGCAVIKGHFLANRRWRGTTQCSSISTATISMTFIKVPAIPFRVAGSFAPGNLSDLLVPGADAGATER